MRWIIAIPAILLLLAARPSAAEPDQILWILPEFPPVFISEKPLFGQGYGDGELRYLIEHLPQFHHVVMFGTAPRLWHEMENRDGVCAVSMARLPEREKFAVFSARHTYGLSNQVIVRADRLVKFEPYLDKAGRIDLTRLAADEHLQGAYSDGTTYGPAIDAFIKDPERKTPLELTAHIRTPIGLLDKERLDFVFGFHMEAAYYRRTHPQSAEFITLATVPDGGREDSYIACSKGPIGRQAVAAIDALLASDEALLDYVENLRGWYSSDEFEAARKAVTSAGR